MRIIVTVFKVTNSIETVMLDIIFQVFGVMLIIQLQEPEFFFRP